MITNVKINPELKQRYYDQGYWSETTLYDVWCEQVAQHGGSEFVCDSLGTRLTYAEVDKQASYLAAWLESVGVGPGDVVSCQLPPWAEFCVVYIACLKVGAVSHPLSVTFNGEDLIYAMNAVQTKAFICPTFHHKTNYEEQIIAIVDRIASLPRCAVAVVEKTMAAQFAITFDEIFSTYAPYSGTYRASSDDVALILSTSGTTGRPKAALFTHNSVLFSAHTFIARLGLTHCDVMFMPAPLNHATGFKFGIIVPMVLGGRVVLQHEFNAAEAFDIIGAEGITWSMGATPFISDLLDYAEEHARSFGALKLYVCGGTAVPSALVQRAYNHEVLLCECYGSTESSPHVLVAPEHCLEWNGRWSGCACDGVETKVVDAQGKEVPFGHQGEEYSRGPQMFCGYLNDKQATDEALFDDGWFASGDLCSKDEQGRICITGRKKEILIRGGINISFNEVDEHIAGCPGVVAHATVGMPDKRLGERICTFVVPASAASVSLESVTTYLASQGVAKRLWPERIECIDAIPTTDSGKVKRNVLVRELEARMRASAS